MTDAGDAPVVYEQPLSERIRSFLRLEHLFERADHQLSSADSWSSRATLDTLMDVMALVGRSDIKKEIIKELERHATTLQALSPNPNVDGRRLEEVLGQVQHFLGVLKYRESPPGYELRFDDFLSSVRQRSSIPAGTCDFDLPNLHFWLQGPPETRANDLRRWLSAFAVMREAIVLCLRLVRQSSEGSWEVARGGFYQRTLDSGSPCQLIRVTVTENTSVYPEVSAGRHRFTIRFMRLVSTDERPVQSDEDIAFHLNCCAI